MKKLRSKISPNVLFVVALGAISAYCPAPVDEHFYGGKAPVAAVSSDARNAAIQSKQSTLGVVGSVPVEQSTESTTSNQFRENADSAKGNLAVGTSLSADKSGMSPEQVAQNLAVASKAEPQASTPNYFLWGIPLLLLGFGGVAVLQKVADKNIPAPKQVPVK